MPLRLFRSLWTTNFDLEAAVADVSRGWFDGIEGPVPRDANRRAEFVARLSGDEIPFIAEIALGGGYVPTERSANAQLEELRRTLATANDAKPILITCLAGCDAWAPTLSIDFFGRALSVAREAGTTISFETHRSRPTFTPWATATLLRQLPDLRLTCDFSHWCCVSERLVLDEEPGLLALFARHAQHVHARIGYAQGPQVPDPAAAEYRAELRAHERWWDVLLSAAPRERAFTMTPEFGPDGYLQSTPHTQTPAANLDEINRWMGRRLRERFGVLTPVNGGHV